MVALPVPPRELPRKERMFGMAAYRMGVRERDHRGRMVWWPNKIRMDKLEIKVKSDIKMLAIKMLVTCRNLATTME